MLKSKSYALIACILSTAVLLPTAKAEKVTATGRAPIRQGDKANACAKALADARRNAVEKAVGVLISAETLTKNFQLIEDKILSQADGYVSREKVLSETEKDGVCLVTISAEVKQANLDKDLQAKLRIIEAKGMPHVLVMITEQNIGGGESAWWTADSPSSIDLGATENIIMEVLGEQGFTFVDRGALTGTISVGKAMGNTATDAGVKSIAADAGADIVIYGKAFAVDKGEIMGTKMRSALANISVRVLATDTAKIIATYTGNGGTGHIEPAIGGTLALKIVGRKAANELAKKIFKVWKKEVSGTAQVSLIVSKVAKSKHARLIKAFIANNINGVQKVNQRGYKRKVARYDVTIRGNAQDLAEELEEKKFPGFAIEIDEVTGNKVMATIISGKSR